MKYAVEQDGGGIRLVLENGDAIMAKLVIGNISDSGQKLPDGTTLYQVQHQVVLFVTPAQAVQPRKESHPCQKP